MLYRPHRYQTHFPILVRAPNGSQNGYVLDVNCAGARLDGLHGLGRGDKIKLDVLSHWVEAIVRWSVQDQVGIVFRPHITEHQVDTLRHRCNARKHPQRGASRFGFAEMR